MFNYLSRYLKFGITVLIISALMVTCSPKVINDFFGIAMNPEYVDEFQIISYSVEGVNYRSNDQMNPQVYAYAELQINSVLFKIVNMDTPPIHLDYNYDEYILHTIRDEKYQLLKGNYKLYASIGDIGYKESVELTLDMPSDFFQTIGIKNPQSLLADYTEEYWEGENRLNFAREEINHIEVILGKSVVLILKPIP